MENDICTIWYNPACSNCRGTLERLESKRITLEIRHYLEDPPTAEDLIKVCLHVEPLSLIRQKEKEFDPWRKEANELSQSRIIDILTAHPKILQRPVVFYRGAAIISRPPERVEELFQDA